MNYLTLFCKFTENRKHHIGERIIHMTLSLNITARYNASTKIITTVNKSTVVDIIASVLRDDKAFDYSDFKHGRITFGKNGIVSQQELTQRLNKLTTWVRDLWATANIDEHLQSADSKDSGMGFIIDDLIETPLQNKQVKAIFKTKKNFEEAMRALVFLQDALSYNTLISITIFG